MNIGVVIHKSLLRQIFDKPEMERLNKLGKVKWTNSEKPISVEEAMEILADCEIAIGSWGTPYPCKEIMDGCPRLRLWEHAAGSVRHMFGEHLKSRNIKIATCGPAIGDDVAEFTLACIIMGMRRILPISATYTAGFERPYQPLPLFRNKIGIIGAGAIGSKVIALLKPFDCQILAYDPFFTEDKAKEMNIKKVTLEEIFKESEVISLHTPWTEDTKGMIRKEHFRLMKNNACFINTARGACIDESALIEELKTGRIYAFLDVTDPEPCAKDSPLRTLDNVVLSPHISGLHSFRLSKQAVDDIEKFINGKEPMKIITEEMLSYVA